MLSWQPTAAPELGAYDKSADVKCRSKPAVIRGELEFEALSLAEPGLNHHKPSPELSPSLAHHEPPYESATAFQEPRGAFQVPGGDSCGATRGRDGDYYRYHPGSPERH